MKFPPDQLKSFACRTEIAAPPSAVMARLTAFEDYPAWVGELSGVSILAHPGAYADVEFRTRVQVRDAIWQLRYILDDGSGSLNWQLRQSNLLAAARGCWQVDAAGGATVLHYHAEMALQFPVSPGVRNRIENIFVGPAIKRGLGLLKQRLEKTEL